MDFGGFESELLGKLMSAAAQRARVLAGNVANQNTPLYQRRVLQFEDLLAAAAQTLSGEDLLSVEPRIELDQRTPSKPDGNNVSLELELNALRENQLMFDTYAAIAQTRGAMLRASILGERSG